MKIGDRIQITRNTIQPDADYVDLYRLPAGVEGRIIGTTGLAPTVEIELPGGATITRRIDPAFFRVLEPS